MQLDRILTALKPTPGPTPAVILTPAPPKRVLARANSAASAASAASTPASVGTKAILSYLQSESDDDDDDENDSVDNAWKALLNDPVYIPWRVHWSREPSHIKRVLFCVIFVGRV